MKSKFKFEAWNWNLKLKFEKWTWNWNLKLKLEIETWNLKLKLEIETWIWNLKLKLKIETRNWNLKLNLEIETWNWTWNWNLKLKLEIKTSNWTWTLGLIMYTTRFSFGSKAPSLFEIGHNLGLFALFLPLRAIFGVGVRFKNFFLTILYRQSTLVLKVQPYLLILS